MKKFFLTLLCLLSMVAGAHAAPFGAAAFTTYSGASAAVKTSAAYNVSGYKTKTLTVTGVTLTSSQGAPTFKNMSGTFIVQCAPTSSGPWSTCSQSQVASAPAVSLTTNNQLTWADAVAYVRLKWTASTSGQKVKAWLNWLEN